MAEASENTPRPTSSRPPRSRSLIATFASQASVAFGHIANPIDGKTMVRLDLAKHAIDMLAVIQEKTMGNLSGEEASMLENVLHQLRVAYVEASKR